MQRFVNNFTLTDRFSLIQNNEWKSPLNEVTLTVLKGLNVISDSKHI